MACNGSETLCDRRYDEVAFATSHNAMSNQDEGWLAPNHYHGISDQLAAGVRGLMLDTHYDQEQAHLCHAICQAGKKPLVDGLAEIRGFLDAEPRAVLTIIFESYISAEDTEAAFVESGLDRYAYAHVVGDPWPTLRDMITANQRLVIFTDNEGGSPPWYHRVWDHCWETHYHFESPDELSCDINRGDNANPLFILNHFLTSPFASPDLAETINHNPLFLNRALQCREESGRLPNFVTVDFHSIGDLLDVVDELNSE
jgi:hypothetical protein